jgi:hypothetical protein
MENVKTYWCKTFVDRNGSLKIIEIYLGEDGLYRVYTDRKTVGFVFGSWEAIEEKFPMIKGDKKEGSYIM